MVLALNLKASVVVHGGQLQSWRGDGRRLSLSLSLSVKGEASSLAPFLPSAEPWGRILTTLLIDGGHINGCLYSEVSQQTEVLILLLFQLSNLLDASSAHFW